MTATMSDSFERATHLLQQTYAEGEISEGSKDALVAVGDVGVEVATSLGSDITGDELLLVSLLVDDSVSVGPYAHAVINGHNLALDALDSGNPAQVLVHTRYLNEGVLSPYTPLAEAARLSALNYRAIGGLTQLYRQSVITLGSVMAQTRELVARGARVRTFTLIITDGADNASEPLISAGHVKFLVGDMLRLNTNHIVAGMGIGDEKYFREIFAAMGIPVGWILVPQNTEADIRVKFRTIAAKLKLATSEAGFLQLSAGPGFDDA